MKRNPNTKLDDQSDKEVITLPEPDESWSQETWTLEQCLLRLSKPDHQFYVSSDPRHLWCQSTHSLTALFTVTHTTFGFTTSIRICHQFDHNLMILMDFYELSMSPQPVKIKVMKETLAHRAIQSKKNECSQYGNNIEWSLLTRCGCHSILSSSAFKWKISRKSLNT